MDREACLRQVSLSEMPALYRSMQDNRKEMDMFTSFLIKYAEIGVKGKNRYLFEDALVRQIRHALKKCDGEFQVRKTDGRIYVDAVSAFDFEDTVEMLKTIYPATGESMPPDNKSIALPPVPTGIPPGPGMISE